MITIADAVPGDEDAITALCGELDDYYGQPTAGTPQQRADRVRAVFFAGPPMARALLAWDGPTLAGLASYSFLWPAAGLSASLYLKELYVAAACRRAGTGTLFMNRLFAVAAEKGCSRVEWTTDADNTSTGPSTKHSARRRCRQRSSTARRPCPADANASVRTTSFCGLAAPPVRRDGLTNAAPSNRIAGALVTGRADRRFSAAHGRPRPNAGDLRACRSLTRRLDLGLDSDVCRSCELVEIIEAGEAVRAGLDGVSGLVQELADVADALVDRLGPHAE